MGQEIQLTQFEPEDFALFDRRLAIETELLAEWLNADRFSVAAPVGGFELEGWLIDRGHFPASNNALFLERLANPLVVPELSKFNVELNGTPQPLAGKALSLMEAELTETWRHCLQVAGEMECSLLLIGILPTVRECDLSLANISPLNRYRALNAQILKRRLCQPLRLKIEGDERLALLHEDVMLEAATTSFQVHVQVRADEAVRYFNAAQILSAPMVAVAANSPFLFAKQLWDETRIPLFEQAVDTCEERRVTFGSTYLGASPVESFVDNRRRFPVLLPVDLGDDATRFNHLRLHNGTIWRWNRLLVGQGAEGSPHLRIEHRVMPAGPSIVDMIANAALFIGSVHFLAHCERPPEADLPFNDARANFYRAARGGLNAEAVWLDGKPVGLGKLLLGELIPMACEGLRLLGIDGGESLKYLTVIRERVSSGQNGASWQKAFVASHGRDFFKLTAAYLQHQQNGRPVHEWGI
jgi:hypothetical protein